MTAIRLSPSGPVIENSGGGPFNPGTGARLRLTDLESPMSGSLAIPTSPTNINLDGFLGTTPLVLTINNPSEALRYRADLRLDLFNSTTSTNATVVLYLQTSVDGGTTWTTQRKNAHVVQPQLGVGAEDNGQAREASLAIPLGLGSALGVVDGTTTSLKLRAQAQNTANTAVLVNSSESVAFGESTISGLDGTIYMSLEECF